jgi:hypothetical protein
MVARGLLNQGANSETIELETIPLEKRRHMMKRTMMIGTILLLAGMLAVPVFARGPGQA